jgi:hypothetical protein
MNECFCKASRLALCSFDTGGPFCGGKAPGRLLLVALAVECVGLYLKCPACLLGLVFNGAEGRHRLLHWGDGQWTCERLQFKEPAKCRVWLGNGKRIGFCLEGWLR